MKKLLFRILNEKKYALSNTLTILAVSFVIGSLSDVFSSFFQMIHFSLALGLLVGIITARLVQLENKKEDKDE